MPRDLSAEQTDIVRDWLRRVVERHGLGNKELQEITGVGGGTLRNLLHDDDHPNQTKNAKRATVKKISAGFGLEPADLLAHAEGRRELPIPDITPHPAAEPLERQVQDLRDEVSELRQTLARIARRLEQ